MDAGINNDISEYKDSLFFGLRNYLYEEHGIFINLDKKGSVTAKLHERMMQLNIKAINEYLYLMDSDSGFKNEKSKLFEILDFNEYYFNSNPDQIDAAINEIIAEIFNDDLRTEDKKIRILVIERNSLIQSYSLFFALNAAFHSKKPDWVFQIQSCDIEENNRDGTSDISYDKKYLQNMSTEAVKKYFLKTNDIRYRIKDEYAGTISLKNFDFIKSGNQESLNQYDLIFCRNIMFLYEKQYKNLAAKTLYSLLKPGGFLFLGEEESLHGIAPEFKLFLFPGSLAYKKE
jgi:chemotaxis protein methyltransferase CheR